MTTAQTSKPKHNVLITGGSGYLGGSILAYLSQLPSTAKTTTTATAMINKQVEEISNNVSTIYALVRSEAQTTSILNDYTPLAKQKNGIDVKPITFNTRDQKEIEKAVRENGITVVFWLIDVIEAQSQIWFIEALAKVKEEKGVEVHFLHTSGAKLFSSLAGAPTDQTIYDTDENVYDIQKSQVEKGAPHPMLTKAVQTNNTVIETSERLGVRSYIFVPCIVYGKGLGVGNPISIQTTAIVKAAKAVRKMYRVDEGKPLWPVSHIADTASLYISLLANMLSPSSSSSEHYPPHGKQGYYLASSGRVAWVDVYAAVASALHHHGLIDDTSIDLLPEDDNGRATLLRMAEALGCEDNPDFVKAQIGGECAFASKRGTESLGWMSVYDSEHVLSVMEDEVKLILENI